MPADERLDADDQFAALNALAEPNRRKLYEYIATAGDWVGRDETADAVGIQRGTAAHHLDRLADEGLLEVDYRRLTGRSGPGAGRPAKVFRRSHADIGISLPPRDYEFAGQLLADAVVDAQVSGSDVSTAVDRAAQAAGRQIGATMRARLDEQGSTGSARSIVNDVLEEHGFEPREQTDGTVVLRNCPFHRLAQTHTELVCGMNHCLLTAAVDEFDAIDLDVSLQPDPEVCCVRLHRR